MKKPFIIFICIVYFSNLNAQDYQKITAIYDINYNTELPNTKTGILEINKNNAVFIIEKKESNKESLKIKVKDNEIIYKVNSKKDRFIYTDYKVNLLFTTFNIYSRNYIIKEKIPNFKWELSNETKKIDNYLLHKATTYFRGRNYIAWYSIEIPIKAGPWKFQGLPGLIFEVFDETKRYHWVLKKIVRPKNPFSSFNKKDFEEITIKQYVEIRYEKKPNLIFSKLPRGTKIVKTKLPQRNSIEIKFEWEEETTKN